MMNKLIIAIKCNPVIVWLRIMIEKIGESFMLTRFNGSTNQTKDIDKKETELQIRAHALEKGMSIGDVRAGFGKPKATSLLADLADDMQRGGHREFAEETISVVQKYVDFNKSLGADMSDIQLLVDAFCKQFNIQPKDQGGVYHLHLADIEAKRNASFPEFSATRFSIRDFGEEPLDIERLKAAFKVCEKTPSACNRQSWRIHVYTDKAQRERLFRLQGGSKGFDNHMQVAILICGDLRNYGFFEQNLPYVDGGLYAMNLLYALHHEGVAAIPLTMGRKFRDIQHIKKVMGIPQNEMPVLLIGVGTFKSDYRAAVSYRYDYKEYVKFE